MFSRAVAATIGILSFFGDLHPAYGQFTPAVETSFDTLNAGATTGYSQTVTFFEGQQGPATLVLTLDRGSFDFSGLNIGDVVGNLTVDIFVDLPFPLPDVNGVILGELRASALSPASMEAEAVGTFVDPILLIFLMGLGFADPTGMVVGTVGYTDFPGDSGVEMSILDAGVLPTSGVATTDVPAQWLTAPIYVHSPARGTLTVTTTIGALTGRSFTEVETFDLVGGGGAEFRRGDVSGNGEVALGDGIDLLNFLFVLGTPAPGCLKSGDADDTGSLGLADAIYVFSYLFVTGAPPPPAPGPENCGADPTSDALTCADSGAC